jgi:hypothetical protein
VSVLAELTDDELAHTLVAAAETRHAPLWLTRVLPAYVGADGGEDLAEAEQLFAPHHLEYWSWLWSIEPGVRPDPFVGVWGRGEAKSTSAEMGCVALGCRGRRRYGLYVSGTQKQADDHVATVGGMLESGPLGRFYPAMGARLVGLYGSSKGWRRNRLRTAAGFTIDAIGMDTAARGAKLDEQRPDFIVIDDVDAHDDSPAVIATKIDLLTKALLPAGSPDCAVLAIQNKVHSHGIFARLVDGRADFLARRRVSGPIPAVRDLVTKHEAVVDEHGVTKGRDVVVSGEPTWPAQPLTRIQEKIDDWGLRAFLAEAQHETDAREGELWTRNQLATLRRPADDAHSLARVAVGVDPSGGSGPANDAQGIVVAGRDLHGQGWVLEDATVRLPPRGWGDRAVQAYVDWDADEFVAEVNYGGDMVVEVITGACERAFGPVRSSKVEHTPNGRRVTLHFDDRQPVEIRLVTASRGKRVRAEPIAALYGRPDEEATWSTARVHHAGEFPELEDEMTGWRADAPWSPNRMDALVWALTDLLVDVAKRGRRRSITSVSAA